MSFATTWTEKVESRPATIGPTQPTATLVMFGLQTSPYDDEADAHLSLRAVIPFVFPGNTYTNLTYQNYTLKNMGGGLWEAVITYGRKDFLYTFDTGGGSQKITQALSPGGRFGRPRPPVIWEAEVFTGNDALTIPDIDQPDDLGISIGWTVSGFGITDGATVIRIQILNGDAIVEISIPATATATEDVTFTPPSTPVPDFKGAINCKTDGNVEGVDVEIPAYHWEETYHLPPIFITTEYKRTLFLLTGSINNGLFRGLERRECKFLGVRGCEKGEEDVELCFRFAGSPTRVGFLVGDITVGLKMGWDYMWVRYVNTVNAETHTIVQTPDAVYVEQVYPEADFSLLGIGT